MSNNINGVPADRRPVPASKSGITEREFVLFVCLPDHMGAFCYYTRESLAASAAEVIVLVDDVDPVDSAAECIERSVRSYLHYGDAPKAVDEIAFQTYNLLRFELADALFEKTDFAVASYDPVSGDMSVSSFTSESAFERAVESTTIDCEVRRDLGLPIPQPKYRPAEPVTLH